MSFARPSSESAFSYDAFAPRIRACRRRTVSMLWLKTFGRAGMDVAVAAGARAGVTKDLEGRRPAAPALPDVRAARLLADRVEARPVNELLDVVVARVRTRRADLHPLRPAGPFSDGQRGLHGLVGSRGRGLRRPGAPRRIGRRPPRLRRARAAAPRRRRWSVRARRRSS